MPEAVAGTFTQIPASTAFSALYARVQNYVLSPSDTDAVSLAKEGINEAIDRLNTRNWNWARVASSITLTAGTQEYALNGAFRAPRMAELLGTSGEVQDRLMYLAPTEFSDLFPFRNITGTPSSYTIFDEFDNGKLTLDVTPSSSYVGIYPTLRFRYYKRVPKLAADADVFYGPTEAESFLVWYGRATIAAHWSPERIGFANQRQQEFWNMLLRSDSRQDTTGF